MLKKSSNTTVCLTNLKYNVLISHDSVKKLF